MSPYTVNYDINSQICLWKRIREALVYINSRSWTRVLIKRGYFGFGCVLYDLLYICFKGKFSVTYISSMANVMHLGRVNLIFEGKNYKMFPFYLTSFFPMWNVIEYYMVTYGQLWNSNWLRKMNTTIYLYDQWEFYSNNYFLFELYLSWKWWPTCIY